jgi:lipoprotein-releasing system permease protein
MSRGYASPDGVGIFELNYGPPVFEGPELPGVIIGTDVLFQHGEDGGYNRVVPRGARVVLTLLPLTVRGTIAEDPVPVAMRYADDSRTRVYEIDSFNAYIDFDLAQKLLSMGPLDKDDGTKIPPRANQLLIKLRAGSNENIIRHSIQKHWEDFYFSLRDKVSPDDNYLLEGVGVETWQERQRAFISAVEKERGLVTLLFGIISGVSIVLIGVIFHMIVLQKTRDIGILKSLGASGIGVATIFLTYGAVVGVIGGILGSISGSIFVHYINEVQDLLASINPQLRVWSPDVYTFDRIPNVVKPMSIIGVFVFAVITAMAGALWPAIKAARVWPVKALRYE